MFIGKAILSFSKGQYQRLFSLHLLCICLCVNVIQSVWDGKELHSVLLPTNYSWRTYLTAPVVGTSQWKTHRCRFAWDRVAWHVKAFISTSNKSQNSSITSTHHAHRDRSSSRVVNIALNYGHLSNIVIVRRRGSTIFGWYLSILITHPLIIRCSM